jgi:hypothetical protein
MRAQRAKPPIDRLGDPCGFSATKLLFLLWNRTFLIYARIDVDLTRITGLGRFS